MDSYTKEGKATYIAHKTEGKEQYLKTHLDNVARLAHSFAGQFNAAEIAFVIGYLHDVGKYSRSFQNRIRGAAEATDHSTAGAQLADRLFGKQAGGLVSKVIGYCISGHHSGLPDFGSSADYVDSPSLSGRLKKTVDDYSAYADELLIDTQKDLTLCIKQLLKERNIPYDFTVSFFIRMLFSCLVDGDYLDTESFMESGVDRTAIYDFKKMKDLLDEFLSGFSGKEGLINKKRAEILQSCIAAGQGEKGLYSLTVPTGGGKTLSSMAFALNHVLKHNLSRIIYVIPYSSIIEQTAQVFKRIFGEHSVLEHHYNFEYDYDEQFKLSEQQRKLKLASQNWDMPVIVTTNVQFFQSLYASRGSSCRKLHNIAGSVIIFDEVQMFPYDYLLPCLTAVEELISNYNVSALFCSATQPDFSPYLKAFKPREIIDDADALNKLFKRVKVNEIGKLTDVEIVERIKALTRVLVVVNSRRLALKLHKLLSDDNAFCLTTLLTPQDRKRQIEQIRERLKRQEECLVISTQLIEAGVDIDFPVVYREAAGIDSVVQAAGRCNREGSLTLGEVNVFIPEQTVKTKNSHLTKGIQIGSLIMSRHKDIISPAAVIEYFKHAYEVSDLDPKGIMDCFIQKKEGLLLNYRFREAADKFNMIENIQKPIIIAGAENKRDIDGVIYSKRPYTYLNKLQQSTVMVYDYEFGRLYKDGKLREITEGVFVLDDLGLYSSKLGLDIYYSDDLLTQIMIK